MTSSGLGLDLDHYERRLRAQGFRRVAGIDEAGRGALAGPLVVAAVILPEGFDLDGVDDSKALTAQQREAAYARIVEQAVAYSVCKALPRRIDHRGLHRSNLALFRTVIRDLPTPPDYVLADGYPLRGFPLPHLSIKKGDAVTASVAAASIVAKVTRDAIMDRYHRRYPAYGFKQNKGYGTPGHRAALLRLGPTKIHRHSFVGIASGYYPNPSGIELRRRKSPDAAGTIMGS